MLSARFRQVLRQDEKSGERSTPAPVRPAIRLEGRRGVRGRRDAKSPDWPGFRILLVGGSSSSCGRRDLCRRRRSPLP